MRIERLLKIAILTAALCSSAVSCTLPKQVRYLQNMTQDSQLELENKFEAVIAPHDELMIKVTSYDPKLAEPFSWGQTANQELTYLVDVNGNIQFPVLGEIRVAGLTRLQLQDYIVGLLQSGHYIDEPFVMVRFHDFKVFVLGPDGTSQALTIPNERCTFLEALSLAGGLDNGIRRDKIAVLREVDGRMTMRYLDPRDSKIFNDPYYMLQQNDMILMESRKGKYLLDVQALTPWMYLFSSVMSLATTVVMFLMAAVA